jgi:transcriptional regulator with XRE-family HTH domain
MQKLRPRPPPQPPLDELAELRKDKGFAQRDFAKALGISRLHLLAIERGRRRPSPELAVRWLEMLAPEARLRMFGDVPLIEERIKAIRRLQELSPKFFKAA